MNIKQIISEEIDSFEWMESVPASYKFKPNHIYHFQPRLSFGEIDEFVKNVDDTQHQIKEWLVAINDYGDGLKYVVINKDIDVSSWCSDTPIMNVLRSYPNHTVLDGRREFNL